MESQNSSQSQKVSIPLAIIVAGALIAGAIYFGGGHTAPAGTNNVANASGSVGSIEKVTDTDHIIGSKNAKVVVVEYSDLECPFCKVFHDTMHEIVDNYHGDVAWVFRHFPIAQLHSKAPKEAEAAECAADQGGNTVFWKFIDQVFATTGSNNTLNPSELPRIAGSLGLDVAAFNSCLSSGKHTSEIQADVLAATKAGAQGTPYSVILTSDGKKVPINGAMPYDSVKAQIDLLLK
ncbi:DsbA family protein [Candidatus Parcubacteria bacterium]|nr:DsbA family protein [Candidatus Parcubacteria bacterium]